MADVVAALQYASHKLPVFPVHGVDEDGNCTCGSECSSPAKHPRTPNGLKDASTDTKVINEWWEKWPDSNIGLPTGSVSNWFVIDVDLKSGGLESWADLQDQHSSASDTLVSRTGGGGNHYVYQLNGHDIKNSANQLGQGIDIRSEGGYVVVSPSIHASQERYEWLGDLSDIKPVPDWVIEKLSTPKETEQSDPYRIPEIRNAPGWAERLETEGAKEGERNNAVGKLCGWYTRQNLSLEEIWDRITAFNRLSKPPLDARELRTAYLSGTRYWQQVVASGVEEAPDFREKLNTLVYTFPNLEPSPLEIQCDSPTRKGGRLETTLYVNMLTQVGRKRLIGPLSWTVTSTSHRDAIRRALRGASNAYQWDSIIQTLSALIDEHDRAGMEMVDLRDHMERPWSAFALEPFILDELPTTLFSFGGMGKSMIALAMMVSLNTGKEILPGIKPEPNHRGLYLDWESSAWEHGTRYKQLCKGAGVDPNEYPMLHLTMTRSLEISKFTLAHYISEHRISYLIIDSAAAAVGGDPNSPDDPLHMFEVLRELGLPTLIIAHQPKNAEGSSHPYGSVVWHNQSRGTFSIDRVQSPGSNTLQVAIINRKSNNSGLRKPMGFQFEFVDDAINVTSTELAKSEELSKHLTVIDQVIGVLADNKDEDGQLLPMTVIEICGKKPTLKGGSVSTKLYEYSKIGKSVRKATPEDHGYNPSDIQWVLLDNDQA